MLGRAAILVVLSALCGTGCSLFGDETNEEFLIIHKRNSKIYYDQGDLQRSEQQCRKGLEIDSDDPTLQLTLAYCLLRQGAVDQLLEADSILESMEGWFGTDDWRVPLGRGMVEQSLGRLASATDEVEAAEHRARSRQYLERALELNDESVEAAYSVSLLDVEDNRFEDFEVHSARTIELIRKSDRTAGTRLRYTEDESARRLTEIERQVNRERARGLLEVRAGRAFAAGNFENALRDLDILDELGGLTGADHYNRARMRERTGDIPGAVDDFEKFLAMIGDRIDDRVDLALRSLTELRSQLAEQRTQADGT